MYLQDYLLPFSILDICYLQFFTVSASSEDTLPFTSSWFTSLTLGVFLPLSPSFATKLISYNIWILSLDIKSIKYQIEFYVYCKCKNGPFI